MPWIYLIVAACFEVGFTTFMKLSAGNWRSPWQIGFIASAILSFIFLEQASRSIPLGMAYAIWTGLGATGTLLLGTLVFGEKMNTVQALLMCNLIFSVVALKLAAH
jgi:multidrug transporter EmrE-like cation transporter